MKRIIKFVLSVLLIAAVWCVIGVNVMMIDSHTVQQIPGIAEQYGMSAWQFVFSCAAICCCISVVLDLLVLGTYRLIRRAHAAYELSDK